jgi:hypothetical protein
MMMPPLSTRKFELGAQYLPALNAGEIIAAQKALSAGDLGPLDGILANLAKAGEARTVRTLSAIYSATETEIKAATKDPAILAELIDAAAERPITETLQESISFFFGAALLLGASRASLGIPEPEPDPETVSKPKTTRRSKG